MKTKTKQTAEQFFYEHAGCSYDPKLETAEQGKRRCAQLMAYAERRASAQGCSYEWCVDPYVTSADFSDDPEPWALWTCLMRDEEGKVVEALGGIDFGRDGEPWGDPYRRVVEAELAMEYCANA